MSPHGRLREQALFTMAVDADRARRWSGQHELPPEQPTAQRPTSGRRLMDEMRAKIQQAIQATVFTGG